MFYILIDRGGVVRESKATNQPLFSLIDDVLEVEHGEYGKAGACWVDKVYQIIPSESLCVDHTYRVFQAIADRLAWNDELIPNCLLANGYEESILEGRKDIQSNDADPNEEHGTYHVADGSVVG